jgi:hypothetical protein
LTGYLPLSGREREKAQPLLGTRLPGAAPQALERVGFHPGSRHKHILWIL